MTEQPSVMRTPRSRRWVLSRAAIAAAAAAVPSTWIASSAMADPAAPKLADVDMELVLLAALVDPPKPDTAPTDPAGPHVKAVEQAMIDLKLLDADNLDEHFGSATVAAYAAWQESLGYEGIDANGLPGTTTLAKLAEGRFTVVNPVTPGSRDDSYGGKRTNTRTVEMLAEADGMIAPDIILTQGSYTNSNPGSAGTHDGGGVIDIGVNAMSETERWEAIKALRTVGFAAWLRTPDDGFDYHIHAVGVCESDLSPSAQAQVHDYYVGKNGLANHGPDNTPDEYKVDFTWWEKYQRG
ncbi:MAG: peptidoglycan-binding protein [Stackebrandtia sp.]